MIPADVRILTSKDLFVSQAALTGESEPVEKLAETDRTHTLPYTFECPNLAFMGTNVVSGSAVCIAVATGNQTLFGAMAKSITRTKTKPNSKKECNPFQSY